MTSENIKIVVGGSLRDDLNAFKAAWRRAEAGQSIESERVIAFESWAALVSVLSTERYRLLQHLHTHAEPSISALARSLNRQYRRVHDDVVALEAAGLIDRSGPAITAMADTITAEIRL
jgi:predicted transcriptional regulator